MTALHLALPPAPVAWYPRGGKVVRRHPRCWAPLKDACCDDWSIDDHAWVFQPRLFDRCPEDRIYTDDGEHWRSPSCDDGLYVSTRRHKRTLAMHVRTGQCPPSVPPPLCRDHEDCRALLTVGLECAAGRRLQVV